MLDTLITISALVITTLLPLYTPHLPRNTVGVVVVGVVVVLIVVVEVVVTVGSVCTCLYRIHIL